MGISGMSVICVAGREKGGAGMLVAGTQVAMRFLLNHHLGMEVREGPSEEVT